jgi:MoaA/NifB/PqqE/SkfB family radical SAM enzyme
VISARHVTMARRFLVHRLRELHPFEVQALLLNACNLRCAYCCCSEIRTEPMSGADWKRIIRRLGQLGCMRIKFQGGEPTLRSDFRELCAQARRAGIVTAVVTNGMRISQQPDLLDHLDECVVSIDSARPELHDRLRGRGSHAGAVRALDLARERGVRTYVVMVVNRENAEQLEAMLEFCEARGAGFHAQPVSFGLHYTDDAARDLGLDPERVRTIHRQLAAWKRRGRPLMFSPAVYLRVAEWSDYSQRTTRSRGPSRCMAGKFYVHIEADGDVWPCQQHGADFKPMNVLHDGIEAALRHVQQHDCGDCYTAYLNERKLLFGMQPAALWQMVRRG